MALPEFQELTEQEQALLMKAPVLITVLIAGADEEIDSKEKLRGKRLASYRTTTAADALIPYYNLIEEGFEEELEKVIEIVGDDSTERVEVLTEELARMKDILPKIDAAYAEVLVKSWRTWARQIAEASGGFIGFGSVNEKELALVDLPMLGMETE